MLIYTVIFHFVKGISSPRTIIEHRRLLSRNYFAYNVSRGEKHFSVVR